MTYYVCIAAVRIQTWIARTPQLKLMRGASIALHECTRPPIEGEAHRIDDALGTSGAARCKAAGNVDGVVVFECDGPDTARVATAAAVDVLRHQLPAIEWEVWGREATDYFEAFRHRQDPQTWRLSILSAGRPLGLAESCGACRQEVVDLDGPTLPTDDDDERTRLGIDCAARYNAQEKWGQRQEKQIDRENDRWISWPGISGRWPDGFAELCRQGGLDPTPSDDAGHETNRRSRPATHLATIAADGNSMGLLFSELRTHAEKILPRAVALLNDTAHEAVEWAAQQAGAAGAEVKIALPHYVGGDDILVSVPAWAGWRFAVELAERFDQFRVELTGLIEEHAPALTTDGSSFMRVLEGVSLGVGMVFAHYTYPFAESRRFAHDAMREAKKDTQGRHSAVGWTDLTESVEAAPRVVPISEARRQFPVECQPPVFRYTPSARSQLGKMVRDIAPTQQPGTSQSTDPTDGPLARSVRSWAERTQNAEPNIESLENDLSRARWWPNVRVSEQPDGGNP